MKGKTIFSLFPSFIKKAIYSQKIAIQSFFRAIRVKSFQKTAFSSFFVSVIEAESQVFSQFFRKK